MPPHNDTVDALTATVFPAHGTTTTYDIDGFVRDTMVNPRTITETRAGPLYRAYTTKQTPWTVTVPGFVTQDDLEKAIHKIYQIIEDHTTLDIPEDEFMRIIKDDD